MDRKAYVIAVLTVLTVFICSYLTYSKELIFQNGQNSYKGVTDTTLNGYDASTGDLNSGGKPDLAVYGIRNSGGAKHFILIRFDDIFGDGENKIPNDARIKKATLYLYKADPVAGWNTGKPFFIVAHPMLVPWKAGTMASLAKQEGTATLFYRAYSPFKPVYWGENNEIEEGPVADIDYDTYLYATTPVEIPVEKGLMSWDITEMVEEWQAGSLENNGIFLKSTEWWDGLCFYSSDYLLEKGLRPKLVVEFN